MLPIGAGLGIVCLYIWHYFSLRKFGSRRLSENWSEGMIVDGDGELYFGQRRVIPDTLFREGDAASIYYKWGFRYVYETHNGVRFCYKQSYVICICSYYGWETVRKLGTNCMNQFAAEPLYGVGLEKRTMKKTNKKGVESELTYWVTVPMADTPQPELTVKLM